MPKDIRSFFKKSTSDTGNEADEFKTKEKKKKKIKKKGVLFDDSSDEEVNISKKSKRKKVPNPFDDDDIIPISDDEVKISKPKKSKRVQTKNLKPTTPLDYFGSAKKPTAAKSVATKRKAQDDVTPNMPKTPKKEHVTTEVVDDLADLLNEKPTHTRNGTVSSKLAQVASISTRSSPRKPLAKKHVASKDKTAVKREERQTRSSPRKKNIKQENLSPVKKPKKESVDDKLLTEKNNNSVKKVTKAAEKKASKEIVKKTPEKKKPKEEEGISEQSKSAKKEGFMKYQQWKNRSGPSAPGSKEVPTGADFCMEGLTFVITGIQESLTRDEIQSIIERYGGKVTGSVSGRTSYLITGDEAGQSKMQKAEKLKTKIITEDEFLELIRTLPGKKSRYDIQIEKQMAEKKKTPSKIKKEPPITATNEDQPSPPIATATTAQGRKISVAKNLKPWQAAKKDPHPSLMWVDKYKPTGVKQIIGQQGANSNVQKLLKWLKSWSDNNRAGSAKPKPKFNPWGGGDPTGASYKAALLSGPPGVGKTTTATLVCKELGFSFVELNASVTRSKRTLKEEVAASVQNTSIVSMFDQSKTSSTKSEDSNHVLIMDEVDGMAGNEDRGGMQELIQIIKSTKIPIICMCNDRTSPKMRSLVNYCFDLRFQRPRVEQITGAMMSICYKEGMTVQAPAVQAIIKGCNQDVRQVLHNLNMIRSNGSDLTYDEAKKHAEKSGKDVNIGIFDIARKLLSTESGNLSISEKSNLFFMDYSIIPKFVQENYLHVSPFAAKGNLKEHLRRISLAADSMATGELIENTIQRQQSWSMLPMLGLMSTVLPCDYMRGGMHGMINFPAFFGKLSTTGKNRRLLQELKFHSSLATCGVTERAFNLDGLSYMRWHLCQPLIAQSASGENHVTTTTSLLASYDLMREDFDSLLEVGQFPGRPNYLQKVDSKVKSAFTRTFNKESHMIPYAVLSAAAKKKSKATNDDFDVGEGENLTEASDDDVNDDGMIKETKKKAPARKAAKKTGADSSKRGRGKKK